MRKTKFNILLMLLLLFCFFSSITSIHAAIKPGNRSAKRSEWVQKKGNYYYYNEKGRLLKNGIYTIKNRKYYFDKNGAELSGWRKIGKNCYFFRNTSGHGKYMVTKQIVDGIRLDKNGKAVPRTARGKAKLPIMVRVQLLVDRVVSPGKSRSEKLLECFQYIVKNYWDRGMPWMDRTHGSWDLNYCKHMLDHNYGNCICFAVLFSYMANALGYQDVATAHDGEHGWTEIGSRFYDPEWAQTRGIKKCFAVPASLSGKDGRPDWAHWKVRELSVDA